MNHNAELVDELEGRDVQLLAEINGLHLFVSEHDRLLISSNGVRLHDDDAAFVDEDMIEVLRDALDDYEQRVGGDV